MTETLPTTGKPSSNPRKKNYSVTSTRREMIGILIFLLITGMMQGHLHGQTILAEDNAGNYTTWDTGSNAGTGFGAWTITTGNNAGAFLGDPALAGISGMPISSFGLYANPETPNNDFVNADRSFSEPMPVGATFSFQWGVNFDSNGSGSKGFNLYSGATQLLNINMGNSAEITIMQYNNTPATLFSNYGTAAMTINIRRISETQLRVFATGRDGSESFDQTFTFLSSEVPDAFRFYAANLDTGDDRQPYFNNLLLKDNSGYTATANELQHPGIPFTISISNAKDINNTPLQGEKLVKVTSIDGFFAGEGEVFNALANFSDGAAELEIVLYIEGDHRLETEVAGVTYPVTLSPDIIVIDFSNFGIDAPETEYASVAFNVEISNAQNVTGAFITGTHQVTITSSQQPGDGIVFNEAVTFGGSGGTTLSLSLSQGGTSPGLEHILAINIEGVTDTKTHSINIIVNAASFDVFFLDGITEVSTFTITAGALFELRIKNAFQEDGSTHLTGTHNVIVTSNQQEERDTIAATFDAGGNADITLNPEAGSKTITKAVLHTLTVFIPSVGLQKNRDGLTVNPAPAAKLKITQQPTGGSGSFLDTDVPLSANPIIVITTDQWENESAVGEAFIGIELVPNDPLSTANLLQNGQSPEGAILSNQSSVAFENLTLDKNGIYRLRFFDNFLGIAEVFTEPFEMTNMEDLSGFNLINPGPQLQNVEFLIPVINLTNESGTLITGSKTVEVRNTTQGVNYHPVDPVVFTDGEGFIPVTVTQTGLDNNIRVRIFDALADPLVFLENNTTITFVATDASGFSITPPGEQIAGNLFNLGITNGKDKANGDLTGNRHVVVTDINETVLFADSVAFTTGAATITGLQLFETGDRDVTVAIDWVTHPVTTIITVNPGISITDNSNNLLGPDQANFVFSPLIFGYSQAEADAISETITITRVGTVDVFNLSVTPPANFTAGTLSSTVLNANTPSATFTLTPNTGIAVPGVTNQTTTINYEYGTTGSSSVAFNVDFPVNHTYQVELANTSAVPSEPIANNDVITLTSLLGIDVSITNTGTGTIENLSVFLSGQNVGAFDLTPPLATTILSSEATTFTIAPKFGLVPGTYTATVNVAADNNVSMQFGVTYTETESGLSITLTPSGPQFLGIYSEGYNAADAARLITITNTGNQPVTSFSVTLGGSPTDFEVSYTSVEIPVGETASFTVNPAPGLTNNTFASDVVTVTASGTDPDVSSAFIVRFLADKMEWDGSINSDWNLANNWGPLTYAGDSIAIIPAIVPNRFADIVIPSTTTRNPVIASQNIRTRSLEIQDGVSLTVQNTGVLTIDAGGSLNLKSHATNNGGHLIVSNSVVNNGSLNLETTETNGGRLTVNPTGRITSTTTGSSIANAETNKNNFIIQSSASGSGSVILNSAGVYATVERHLLAQAFHMVAPPVSGQSIPDFIADPDNNIAVSGTGLIALRTFDEATNAYSAFVNDVSGWGNFNPGQGYTMARAAAGNVSFRGALLPTNQGYNVTRTESTAGWNLIGNPFPSSLGLKSFVNGFLNPANIDELDPNFAAIYIFDPTLPYGERYFPVNNATSGTNYLANAQGFFVRAKVNPGSVNFTTIMRAHQNTTVFKNGDVEEPEGWHRVGIAMSNPSKDAQTLLAFNTGMTTGLDVSFDAGMYVNDTDFMIYSRMPNNETLTNLAIQALPDEGFADMLIPLGVKHTAGGEVTFTAYHKELPDHLRPLLNDAQKNTFTDLYTSPYSTIMEAGEPALGRFFLRIQDSRNMHTVTFGVAGDGGEVTAEAGEELLETGAMLPEGSAVIFTAIPWAGYAIDHWLVNGVQTGIQDEIFVLDRLLGDTYVQVVFTDAAKFDGALDAGKLPAHGKVNMYVADERIIIEGLLEENTIGLLFDIMGRKILEENLETGPSNVIPVKGLQEGYYILHLVSDSKHETKRLFIR